MTVVLYGPAYSTYVRTVRLAREEKAVAYDLREIDLLKGEGQRPEHKARHPFGKAPVLEHDGSALFETVAIARYVDEAFPGPRLQPEGAGAIKFAGQSAPGPQEVYCGSVFRKEKPP